MFALRGIAVSLTFFVLVYSLLSASVAVSWRWMKLLHAPERRVATLLFALRVLPLVSSVVITFAFVVPSFQLLEPRSININIDEGIGTMPLALGVCALLLLGWGCFRVLAAQSRTSRVVAGWLEGARSLDADGDMSGNENGFVDGNVDQSGGTAIFRSVVFRSRREAPPLTLVGVRRSRVLVSESTVALLARDELRMALKHEVAHMRFHDNLKKLVFRFCPFPGMAKLESAWSQAAELAADDAAVSNVDDAVNLAAALVKLSRLVPVEAAPVCTVGFVTGSISARVARLLAWNEAEDRKAQPVRMRAWQVVPPVLAVLSCVVAVYGPLLALTHEVTEWMVR
jgi:hypothetical protein